jgi:trehalose 6-phosphate synthase
MFDQPKGNRRGLWNENRLQSWHGAFLEGQQIVVLANREPVMHQRTADGSIVARRAAGGLVTCVEPLVRACRGTWVAHGAGTGDELVVDGRDSVGVPPASPQYRLRRVWLNRREEQGYYDGFANEALWPLCHQVGVHPVFRSSDFDVYRRVNARFAAAVHEEAAGDSPVVLVQDYHFALAPQMVRERLPLSTIVAFWHIPWPEPCEFRMCPWTKDLLRGLLGSDLVGFQTPSDCTNFLETVGWVLNAEVRRDVGVISYGGHDAIVRAYPVSIEWPNRHVRRSPPVAVCRHMIHRQLDIGPETLVGVGVDRLDYTKGIEEKFLAVERLLELRPDLIGRFVFVQLAEPSRQNLPAYRDLRCGVWRTSERINARFGAASYRPVILLQAHHDPEEVYRFLRGADLCYVASLRDGMNLVAKEFVSARDDEAGVLILSRFAGAACQLSDALLVNPCSIDEAAQAMSEALNMQRDEQVSRMRRMRSAVAEFNAYWWAGRLLQDAAQCRRACRAERTQDSDARILA